MLERKRTFPIQIIEKKTIHHAFTPISFPSLSFLGEYKWKILCNSECELGEGGNEWKRIQENQALSAMILSFHSNI